MSVGIWLKEMRTPFFTASLIPVFLGAVYAFYLTGFFHLPLFLLTLIGVVFLHGGTNLANEFFDFKSGTDAKNRNRNPFSGGTGFLPAGKVSPGRVHKASVMFFLLGGAIGVYLLWLRGIIIGLFGLIGAVSGYFYTSPRINFSGRGVGEFLVGLNFGILIVAGTFFVQTGFLSLAPLVISLPVTFLITAVLYINQFPDYEADKEVGKHNLVVRMGREKAVRGYELLLILTYVSLIISVLAGFLPLLSLLALITLPLALKSRKIARKSHSSFPDIIPAQASTVLNHLFTGIILIVTLAVASFL